MLENVFLVNTETDDVFLIYAPLQMKLFAVNKTGAEAFTQFKRGIVPENSEVLLDTLEANGFFESPPPILNSFEHADLTLCPTFRCQLRCVYCFSSGGERLNDLSLEAAKSAVDLALSRCKNEQIRTSRLTWHGGGESTLAWGLLQEVSQYHKERCQEKQIQPSITIVSNGVWSLSQLRWLVENMYRITISCDGPPDIQDLQRPLADNKPSSPIVYRILKELGKLKANFGVRATITEHNVRRMPEMVKFFRDLCEPRTLQFEKLAVCGRCEQTKIQTGSTNDYVKYFIEALNLAEKLGVKLGCSGVRIFRRTQHYCGAAGRTLCVMPNGLLTTCHRVDNANNPLGKEFIFGFWNGEEYKWRPEQLIHLHSSLAVENLDFCQNCFCKYTCAGGCAASRFADTGSLQGCFSDERCQIIRELTRHRLISIAKKRGLFDEVFRKGGEKNE